MRQLASLWAYSFLFTLPVSAQDCSDKAKTIVESVFSLDRPHEKLFSSYANFSKKVKNLDEYEVSLQSTQTADPHELPAHWQYKLSFASGCMLQTLEYVEVFH